MSLSRDKMREYMRKRRQQWEEQGLCHGCGYVRDDPEYKYCSACRYVSRTRAKRYYDAHYKKTTRDVKSKRGD